MRIYRRFSAGHYVPVLTVEISTAIVSQVIDALRRELVRGLVSHAMFQADEMLFTTGQIDMAPPIEHLCALRFAGLMDNREAFRESMSADIAYHATGERVWVLVAHDMKSPPVLGGIPTMRFEDVPVPRGSITIGGASSLLGTPVREEVISVSPALSNDLFETAWDEHSGDVIAELDLGSFTQVRRATALSGILARHLPADSLDLRQASVRLREARLALPLSQMLDGPVTLDEDLRTKTMDVWYGR